MTWTLTHYDRPWTSNAQRQMNHYRQAELVKEWRHAFATLAREAKVPALGAIRITAQSHLVGRRSRDWLAEAPAIKAAVDGLVDAGVIPDDDPTHMLGGTILAPVLKAERNALVLVVESA